MKRYTVKQYTREEWDAKFEAEYEADEISTEEDIINIVWSDKAVCMDIMANGKRLVPILRKIEESMTEAGLAGNTGVYAGWFGEWANSLTSPSDKKYFVWKYDGRQDMEQGCWSYSWEIEQIDEEQWYIFLNLARPEEQPTDPTQEAQEPAEQQNTTDTTTAAENSQNSPEKAEGKKEEKNMENYTITTNPDYNSLEIAFTGKPSEAVRDALKALKFRWHGVRRVWYGYTTEEAARAAIDGAEGTESTQGAQTVKSSSSVATKPDQAHIRIYYNGIKIDGGKLIKCYYSIDNNADHAESVGIIAANYDDLPRDLLPVRNDTDLYTDYFDKDSAYLTPEHPLYKYFRYAGLKDRAKSAEKRMETVKAELNSGRERWTGHYDAYRRELVQLQAHIDAYKAAPDPGQPTAADLEAINRQRQEQENAERAARHAEELAERERVLNARNSGRRFIETTAKAYPIENGEPVVTIEWSENPAFYDWNDTDSLKLSVAAAELILESIDKDVHREGRGYDKTSFRINWKDENGEEMTYSGRYDLGDNDGGLIAHIRSIGEWERTHEEHGKEKATPDETNDRLRVAAYLQQFTAQRRLDHVSS